jgi:hypothetical protein
MERDTPFYRKDDYTYEFRASGKYRTSLRLLGFRPSEKELNRQSRLELKGLLRPKIEVPPRELQGLAESVFATDIVDPEGAENGIIWPVSLTSQWELHVIKLAGVSVQEAEAKILPCIAAHFSIPLDRLSLMHDD